MVLINGRKFACDACIRGHRASSCAHTTRQLLPVRPKGRPSSQCNTCKAKRVAGSFHGKCHCSTTSEGTSNTSSREVSSSAAEDESKSRQTGIGDEGGKNSVSLEALMNPCRCKTTGICTCCKTGLTQEDGGDPELISKSGASCCDGQECCSDGAPKADCTASSSTLGTITKSCCSSRIDKAPLATVPLLAAQSEISQDGVQGIASPVCQCGENCSCPGCINDDNTSTQLANENEECPEKCLTCSACAFGLTRPSGIDVVDEWMEKDKEAKEHERTEKDATELPNKRIKLATEAREAHHPPLPPFANASSFFTSHFLDPDRRNYFAEQMQAVGSNTQPVQFSDDKETVDEVSSFGHQRPGETDEDWQVRHGFYYLTPDAIRIFDSTRRFKDERQQLEEQEERLEHSAIPADSLASSGPSIMSQELSDLRRKALAARKKPSSILSS